MEPALIRSDEPTPWELLKRAQGRLLEQFSKLNMESRTNRTTLRLLNVLDACPDWPKADDPRVDRCRKVVRVRMDTLKRLHGNLTSPQQRDLLVIIFFGVGRLSRDVRLDACALLKLRGSEASQAMVCDVFCGFRLIFRDR